MTGTTVISVWAVFELNAPSLTVTVMSRTGDPLGFWLVFSKVIDWIRLA
ncbi:hypothetical protein [Variovorax sp. UC122_21]